jgi:hypothetical protein
MTYYLVVTGNGSPESVDAYLYGYARRVRTIAQPATNRIVAVVRVDAPRYNADYQSDRLRSGMYGVDVFDSAPYGSTSANDRLEEIVALIISDRIATRSTR